MAVVSEYEQLGSRYSHNILIDCSETSVKVIDATNVLDIILLDGHTKGVRAVTWHPTGLFLVKLPVLTC